MFRNSQPTSTRKNNDNASRMFARGAVVVLVIYFWLNYKAFSAFSIIRFNYEFCVRAGKVFPCGSFFTGACELKSKVIEVSGFFSALIHIKCIILNECHFQPHLLWLNANVLIFLCAFFPFGNTNDKMPLSKILFTVPSMNVCVVHIRSNSTRTTPFLLAPIYGSCLRHLVTTKTHILSKWWEIK